MNETLGTHAQEGYSSYSMDVAKKQTLSSRDSHVYSCIHTHTKINKLKQADVWKENREMGIDHTTVLCIYCMNVRSYTQFKSNLLELPVLLIH